MRAEGQEELKCNPKRNKAMQNVYIVGDFCFHHSILTDGRALRREGAERPQMLIKKSTAVVINYRKWYTNCVLYTTPGEYINCIYVRVYSWRSRAERTSKEESALRSGEGGANGAAERTGEQTYTILDRCMLWSSCQPARLTLSCPVPIHTRRHVTTQVVVVVLVFSDGNIAVDQFVLCTFLIDYLIYLRWWWRPLRTIHQASHLIL